MDPFLTQPSPSHEEDEWDTDGFVIPSLSVENSDPVKPEAIKEETENYLGPHGAPPTQAKQPTLNSSSQKQRFKNKLNEADHRYCGTGRENKVENIRELVGGSKLISSAMPKSSFPLRLA